MPAWWTARLRLGLILVLQAGLLETAAARLGPVWDEPIYNIYGKNQYRDAFISPNPTPAWGFGLLPAVTGYDAYEIDVVQHGDAAWWRLFLARQSTILVTVLGGLALRRAAARWGERAAELAHLMWALSPTVLALGPLAVLDGWVAAALAAVLAAMVGGIGTDRQAVRAGVLTALAVTSKVTAGAVALPLLWSLRGPRLRLAAVGAATVVLTAWAVCGFQVDALRSRDGETVLVEALPAAALFDNLRDQWVHGFSAGHVNQVLGVQTRKGLWWYYLLVLPYKTTVGGQLLALLGLAGAVKRRAWRTDAWLLLLPAVVLVVLSAGRAQLGVRYLLPAWPFVLVWIARGVSHLGAWRTAAFAVVMSAAESLWLHPNQLAFFSVWAGGPDRGVPQLPVGSDWCQARPELQAWLEARQPEALYTVPCAPQLPIAWPAERLGCTPHPGVWALHAEELFRPADLPERCLEFLREREPDAILGHTIWVYEIPPP